MVFGGGDDEGVVRRSDLLAQRSMLEVEAPANNKFLSLCLAVSRSALLMTTAHVSQQHSTIPSSIRNDQLEETGADAGVSSSIQCAKRCGAGNVRIRSSRYVPSESHTTDYRAPIMAICLARHLPGTT